MQIWLSKYEQVPICPDPLVIIHSVYHSFLYIQIRFKVLNTVVEVNKPRHTHTHTLCRYKQERDASVRPQPISPSWRTQNYHTMSTSSLDWPRPETAWPLRVLTWPPSINRDECEKTVSLPARLYASSLDNPRHDLATEENTGNSKSLLCPTSFKCILNENTLDSALHLLVSSWQCWWWPKLH